MDILLVLLALACGAALYFAVKHGNSVRQRAVFIDNYQFPDKLEASVLKAHPHLSNAQANRVVETLREYFHVCNEGGKDFMSMPSEAVDTAWHEFILFTRKYAVFCDEAFGRFLHHTPAEGMSEPKLAQKGIRNTWRVACSRTNINPSKPSQLPTLFAIDAMFKIENGYIYSLNCDDSITSTSKSTTHCVSHIVVSGCGGGGSSDTSSAHAGDAGCGSGCGGGCGS